MNSPNDKQIIQEIIIKNEQVLPSQCNEIIAVNNNSSINVSSITNTGNKNLTNNKGFINKNFNF
jgi:hypothetical protein